MKNYLPVAAEFNGHFAKNQLFIIPEMFITSRGEIRRLPACKLARCSVREISGE